MTFKIENTKIWSKIEEQVFYKFTGKINILLAQNDQLVGEIFLKNGCLIRVKYKKHSGIRALCVIVLNELYPYNFKYVVEPEVVISDHTSFSPFIKFVKKEIENLCIINISSIRLRPANNLKLLIVSDFIEQVTNLHPDEFELLCIISEYCNVSDIYEQSSLLEFETTKILMALRQKNALKVFKLKS